MNANLFLIPLDHRNEWFRYHDMFRESLLNKIKTSSPERLRQLQNRAVGYLISHDLAHEAIEQVVQVEDWELLASLLEKNGNRLIHEGNHLAVLHWLARIPESLMAQSPRLIMLRIWGLFFSNRLDEIQPLLDQLEALIDQQRLDNVATSAHELIDLHSEISLIRSYLARSQSDLSSASRLTRQVLEELDHTNMPLKSVTYYGIGLDNYTVGDLASAEAALKSAIEHGKVEQNYTTVLSSSGLLGWIYFYQGKMELALATGIHNQQWNVSYADPSQPRVISCWQNSVLAMIYIEKAEFTIAETYINPLLKHLQIGTEPSLHIIIQYIRANLLFAQKHFVEAISCLDDALRVYQNKKEMLTFEPPSLSALKARCLIAIGQYDKARTVLEDLNRKSRYSAPLVFEDVRLTQARIELADHQFDAAARILDSLQVQTEEKQHVYHLIQVLALRAISGVLSGQIDLARDAIHRSLALAAQDGFYSVYTNEGNEITRALALCEDPTLPDDYLRQLNDRLGTRPPLPRTVQQTELPGASALVNKLQLLEPLSQRELEVLELIDRGLANKEIAGRLSLAPATVKAHIRNIYGKIQARSRTEALSKARQFGLL
jgi:LuxR family maltose regulon positive regulatory protein